MRSIPTSLSRLAGSFDSGVATRVRVVRKSDGWTVDLSDADGINWVRGVRYSEDLQNPTATFVVSLLRAVGENTLSPLRGTSKVNRNGVVLDVKRWVIVDVQPVPPDGKPDPDAWVELVRGQIDRIRMSPEGIELECRDESARFIDRWQEYERNWPATIPDTLEDVLQDLLDTATYDPGPWVAFVVRGVGDLRRPTTHNGYLYRCTTAGTSGATEPTWNLTPGGTTTDGTATWTNVGAMPAAAWASGATTRVGQLVRPTTRNGYLYQCTTAGTTAVGEPTWPTDYGDTVTDNTTVWALIEDSPDLYTPTSPSWSVTRAAADDYGVPPQAYWDIVRAFVDQIGWDCRFRWVSTDGRRRPTLRSVSSVTGGTYTQNGDAGTFTADQYVLDGDVELTGEHIRNIAEVVYFDGPPAGPRQQTRLRLENGDSIAAYGAQFSQLTMDSAGLINDAAEATKLAQSVLAALARPVVTLQVRVPLSPWIEVGDGLKLVPRPEDAIFDGTDSDATRFVAVVQGLSHRTDLGEGETQLQLRGFYVANADTLQEEIPLQVDKVLMRESRARLGTIPTFHRPFNVFSVIFDDAGQIGTAGTKPGLGIVFDSVRRDVGGNADTTSASAAFVAPVAGTYAVSATVTIDTAPAAGTEAWLGIVSSGVFLLQSYTAIGSGQAGTELTLTVAGEVYLEAEAAIGTYLAFDPSAGSVTTVPGVDKTVLMVRLVR